MYFTLLNYGILSTFQEKDDLERNWSSKIAALTEKHEHEKEKLMQVHRENLKKALEEARIKWQQVSIIFTYQ